MSDAPFGFGSLRRSVIDPVTGAPVITSAPTGEVVQRSGVLPIGRDDSGRLTPAVPGLLLDSVEAARFPGQVWRGEADVFDPATGHVSDEARGKANEIAGSTMLGSMPFSAPKGALRSFGGPAAKDDPLAALEAALGKADIQPMVTPRSFVDPAAKSWDLYHGTAAPTDFARFRTDLPDAQRPHTGFSSAQGNAVFFSPAPDEAAHYALGKAPKPDTQAGPRTIRATVEPGKTGVFDMVELAQQPGFADKVYAAQVKASGSPTDPVELGSIRRNVDSVHQRFLDDLASAKALNAEYGHLGVNETPTYHYMGGGADVAVQMAREQGLDTAIIRGLSESNGGDQVVALTPGRVRSYYSPDQLLYGFAGLTAGGALAATASPDGTNAAPQRAPFGFGPIQ